MEPLVDSYREAAKAHSASQGHFADELGSLFCSARLHEVPRICTPCWEPLHTARSLRPPRPIASGIGRTTPDKGHTRTPEPVHFLQARGEPHEAARDVRALLDLVRENEPAGQKRIHCHSVLRVASFRLKILDPEHGEEELVKSVAAEMAKLVM